MALTSWQPETLSDEADELLTNGIHTAALEQSALALETELRYSLDRLSVPIAKQNIIFDQARFDAYLTDPIASPFALRMRAALMVRQALRSAITRSNAR